MRWHYLMFLLAPAVLLAALILLWPGDSPGIAPVSAPDRIEPVAPVASPIGTELSATSTVRKESPQANNGPANEPEATGEATELGPWRLTGRIELVVDGIDLIRRGASGLEQGIYALARMPGAKLMETSVELDRTGRFSVELDDDELESSWSELLEEPEDLMWEFPVPGADSLLEVIADHEGETPPLPPGVLVRPQRKGRVLDFGVIRPTPRENLRVGTGRLLTTDGAPVCSTARHRMVATIAEDEREYFPVVTDSSGAFVFAMHLPESGLPSNWRFISRWASELDGDGDGTALELAAPTVRGQLCDFGDVRLPGAIVEIRVGVTGADLPPPPGDPFLAGAPEDGDRPPYADLSIDTWEFSFEVMHPLGAAVSRIVLPPSRYRWQCELEFAPHFAREANGALVVRPGSLNRLDIEFALLPTIPVRTLAPDGTPTPSEVWATVAAGSEFEWHVALRSSAPMAPLYAGFPTNVVAEHDKYGRAETAAKAGDTEVVIRFSEQVESVARLRIHLPALHPALGLQKLRASLRIHLDDDRADSQDCQLGTELGVITVDVNPSSMARVYLLGGQAFGYPGGVFCSAEVAPAGQGEHVVHLPPIGPPPWGMPAGVVRASLQVGDTSLRVSGRWRMASFVNHDTLYDGEELCTPENTRQGEARGLSQIPQALLVGESEIPLHVSPPSEPWGEASVRLHVPPRIMVRVTRGGVPQPDFEATAASELGVSASVRASDAAATLWAPAGPATVHVSLFDISLEPRQVAVPADGVIDVHFEIDTVRIRFEAEGHSRRQPYWALMRMTPNGPVHVDYVSNDETGLYPRGRYRLVPDPPYDPAAFVEFDLEDGNDRTIKLPNLSPVETGSVLLRLNPQDMEDVVSADLMYYTPRADRSYCESWSYAYSYVGTDLHLLPDAIQVRGLPKGQRVFIRGIVQFKRADREEVRFLAATEVLVEEGFVITPVLRPARESGWLEGNATMATRSELPGYWLPLIYDGFVAVGTQEIVVLDAKFAPVLQATLTIPPAAQEFLMPESLREEMQARGLTPPADPAPTEVE